MIAKTRFFSAIVGGIVGAIVVIFLTNFSPTEALDSSTNVGDITCTSLRVVDPKSGEDLIVLENGTQARPFVWIYRNGGVAIHDSKGNQDVLLGAADKFGGLILQDNAVVLVHIKDSQEDCSRMHPYGFSVWRGQRKQVAGLSVHEEGGYVSVKSKITQSRAVLSAEKSSAGLTITDSIGIHKSFPRN